MPSNAYHVHIFYSSEDEGFIAVVPQLKGCSAFGKTREDAAREVQVAMDLWIAAAKDAGWSIPAPEKSAPVFRPVSRTKQRLKPKTRAAFRKTKVKPAGRVLRKIPVATARRKVAAE